MISVALPAMLTGAAALAARRSRKRAPRWSGAGYIQGRAVQLDLLPITERHLLRPDAAQAFLRMQSAARAAGIALVVNTAFRTMGEQEGFWAQYQAGTGAPAARPGFSNHQGGIAVDLQTGGTGTPTYRWLAENARRFGFKRTVESEPWHWEYRPAEVSP